MDGFAEVVRWLLLKPDEAFSGWIVWTVTVGVVLSLIVLAWILLDLARAVLRRFRRAFCHVLGSVATVAVLAVLLAAAKPFATTAMHGEEWSAAEIYPKLDWIASGVAWRDVADVHYPFSYLAGFWRKEVPYDEDEDPGEEEDVPSDAIVAWVPEVPEVDAALEETIREMRDKAQVWRTRAIYLKMVSDVWSEFWKGDERPPESSTTQKKNT